MNTPVFNRGFTLIESLITLVIVAILGLLAVPSFSTQLAKTHSDSQIKQIESFFNLGRLSAISENNIVVACPSANHQDCSRDWNQDWILFSDPNRNFRLDEDEHIIRIHEHNLEQLEVRMRPANRGNFRWQALGITHGAPGSVILCHPSIATANRKVTVSMLGRTRISNDSDQDGIHEDRRGRDLDCSA